MVKNIKKRDGRIKSFDKNKIVTAVWKAMKQCNINDMDLAESIAEKISNSDDAVLEVEQVQDMVEEELMSSNHKNVAREYITYRNTRNLQRDKNSELNKRIEQILMCKDIQNSNANVDESSFGGRKFESASEMHRYIALNSLMRPECAKAHMENDFYMHDLGDYTIGDHNCINIDFKHLFEEGFATRNGDVRAPKNFSTACQQVAVIFQAQSQVQFGGVASTHLDYDLAPFVKKSFNKHFKDGLKYIAGDTTFEVPSNDTSINDSIYTSMPAVYQYAKDMLNREGLQAAQGLYHNLNTLESRPGSQVPFTSINFGHDTSIEGRMVSEWMMKASIDGIGKNHSTSIFPISIFCYKKGINANPGDPNYDLKKLAIKSLSKRIYPNIANGDWSGNVEDPNNIDTIFATMGCRTFIGKDRHGMGYNRVGRGNALPVTMNIVKLGILNGICLGKRKVADVDKFFSDLDDILKLTEIALMDRFYYMCSQNPRSADFMYKNGTACDCEKTLSTSAIYETLKHFSLGFGYIGIAECCQAMFGKDHADGDKGVLDFAIRVVNHIRKFSDEACERDDLNFVCYSTPAEGCCYTIMTKLQKEFGQIKNVTDREYLTNSHHVPVWKHISIYDKIDIESQFSKFANGGQILYVELEAKIMDNQKAIEDIIDYAMSKDVPYLALNFPLDQCLDCGYQSEIKFNCPVCGSSNISRLRRVTGYLTTDYRKFNKGKIKECLDRAKHSEYTNFINENEEL